MSNLNKKAQAVCKNCAFAVYEDNTQTGCRFDITDWAPKTECYDEDKEFYVLNMDCLYFNPGEYSTSLYEKVEKKYSFNSFQSIIYCPNYEPYALEKTTNSIINQDIKPKNITFMVEHTFRYDINIFANLMKGSQINWRVENQIEETKGFRYLVDHMLVNANLRTNWYSIFVQGFEVPKNFFKNIYNVINVQKQPVLLFKPKDEHNGLVVHQNLDSFFGGNRQINIEKKLDKYIEYYDLPKNYLCKKFEEII